MAKLRASMLGTLVVNITCALKKRRWTKVMFSPEVLAEFKAS